MLQNMQIQSLNIEYNNQLLITDIDDCLIKSTESIKRLGLDIKRFYLNHEINFKYKEKVFNQAELTEWGKEFKNMIENGKLTNYILLTSASNRKNIIVSIFGIEPDRLIEGMSGLDKVDYLNSIVEPFIYIDDKPLVGIYSDNTKGTFITYPKRKTKKLNYYKKRKRIL